MATLDQLRSKWFLNFSAPPSTFPPAQRYAGTKVSDYTDGNLVTPLIDGQSYMKVWHDSIRKMIGHAGAEVYHSGWRLEGVRTLGYKVPSSDALDTLDAADAGGVQVYVAISRHGFGVVSVINRVSATWLQLHGVRTACLDNRFPPAGSNHQKAVCLKYPAEPKAIVGSIDISKTRWDRTAHVIVDNDRDPDFGKPTHDTGVQIQGPAVADIEHSFIARWNDPTRVFGLEPVQVPQPLIKTAVSAPTRVGTHSVQVLHTYGITSTAFGYSWSPVGEFTIWASYINALRKASTYIYIEDQYFLPSGWPPPYPPYYKGNGLVQASDIIYQLGEAIKRGVKVIVLVPRNAEDSLHVYQKYQRDIGVNYLATIASKISSTSPGDFVVASLGVSPVYVHSKLLIVDDEFVLIGSANVSQRSMSCDGELSVGIVDEAEAFAREFRKQLWAEHLQRDASELDDPVGACALFGSHVVAKSGRVGDYPTTHPGKPPRGHARAINNVIDPYYGPPERGTQ